MLWPSTFHRTSALPIDAGDATARPVLRSKLFHGTALTQWKRKEAISRAVQVQR